MQAELPVLEISGRPKARGRAHGEAFRDEIQTLVAAYFNELEEGARHYDLKPLPKRRVLEISQAFAGPTEAHSPDLFDEARGIAEGSDTPFEEILALNAFLETRDYTSSAFAEAGCTSLMVPGDRNGNGATIGQNYDLPSIFAPATILLRITDSEGPDAIVFTLTGMVGCAGLNSAGIGVVINNLIPADAGPGVIYPFVTRRILASETIGEAMDVILSHPRASGLNYVICDPNGEIYDFETTARDYEVFCPFDGPIAHANHYLSDRFKPLERRARDQLSNSILRWGRATRLLRAVRRPTAGTLRKILADHVNRPIAICRHNQVVHGAGCGQTICGIVLEPPARRIWIARGPVCENEWTAHGIRERVAAVEAPRFAAS
jgi:isopenicillin-N N-acyltransferase-like protein